jgi:hypothetical protein
MPLLIAFLIVTAPNLAWAYPEFIGYKYSSCLTCHFNGQGNGPLNDYGRALWASEIAGRWMAKGRTEEQLGEASGFLGRKPLPWWVRPGVKTRYLHLIQSPGGDHSQARDIFMQADVNAAFFFQRDQSLALIGSFGRAPVPNRYKGQPKSGQIEEWISREHYLRWQASEPWWFYFGFADKVYGIRTVDHTAYSRTRTGLSMNDQAHGVIAHYVQPKFEWSVNGFVGNLYQDSELRQAGFSTMFEYEVRPALRLGASVLHSSNKFTGNDRIGVHMRSGLGFGSAILFESGLIKDTPKGGEAKNGYYVYSEAIQRVVRGYHVFVTGQAFKDDMTADASDAVKTGIGLLAFPMHRLEFRIEAENTRQFRNSVTVPRDDWWAVGQIHVSL